MKVVIVGGVAGGATAAARLRRLDEQAEIIIFERSGYVSYANCGLPYYIGGEITDREELTLQTPESFRRRFNIDVRVRHEVLSLDTAGKNVTVRELETGRVFTESYDKLLLSPGAAPVVLPLTSDPAALEAGLRVYNGKPAVNSVNGDPAVLSRILPLAKRYGAAVVGLTLDQGGLPQSAQERLALARRILEAALAQGIPRRDLWIDCLTLTISAQQDQARETLEAIRQVREELGLQTTLGISNISFGLPQRIQVTRSFLIQALGAGLTLPILNPNQPELMDAVAACRAISGEDAGCRDYIARFAQAPQEAAPAASGAMTLEEAIRRGFPGAAARLAREALQTEEGLSLVETRLIPALDRVGLDYEKGTAFLPQLMGAAQAAQAVFQEVAAQLEKRGGAPVKKGPVILATVRGDIHDIGKNIVKTLMENYGFRVIDLGRDVPVETVVEAARKHQAPLVGLSALMTTTLPAMEQTIAALKAMETPPAVLVGGAVVTPEHARRMGADYYAKDARQSVEIARKVLG